MATTQTDNAIITALCILLLIVGVLTVLVGSLQLRSPPLSDFTAIATDDYVSFQGVNPRVLNGLPKRQNNKT